LGTSTLVIAITLWIFGLFFFLYAPIEYAVNEDTGVGLFVIGIIFLILGIILFKIYDKDRKKSKNNP